MTGSMTLKDCDQLGKCYLEEEIKSKLLETYTVHKVFEQLSFLLILFVDFRL
jgi:hypothetical protein